MLVSKNVNMCMYLKKISSVSQKLLQQNIKEGMKYLNKGRNIQYSHYGVYWNIKELLP